MLMTLLGVCFSIVVVIFTLAGSFLGVWVLADKVINHLDKKEKK